MVVGQKYIILLNNESEIPKRNTKKQEKFKKRRQDWNKHSIDVIKWQPCLYCRCTSKCKNMEAYMAMVYPVSAYINSIPEASIHLHR